MRYLRFYLQLIVLLLSAVLTGCMVGPDFHSPQSPDVKNYTESLRNTVNIPSAGNAGKAQYFLSNRDIPGEWWHLFHSPQLDNLIKSGLANSPNLAAAQAALRQARYNLYAQIGSSLLPSVSGTLSGQRERTPGSSFGGDFPSNEYDLYNASVNISYTLDLFGGARRGIEALCAQVNYSKFQLDAAYLTLTSNIVTTAITVASLRAQIHATQELIHAQQSQLDIVKKQFVLGAASKTDVLSQQAQVAQIRATLPPLEQSLAQNNHALSTLIGQFPSDDQLPKFNLEAFNLPTQLPISIPSRLVRQRPDIQASEALLHAASAQIGVATANMYPQITLTGSFGYENSAPSALFQANNAAWNFGAALTQPIFNGGSLLFKKKAAVAAYEQAAAQYKQTVLQAFQNVADTLRALQHDAQALQAQKQAETAARHALAMTEQQYSIGSVNYLSLLTAERTYQQAQISRIQAQASRYTDTAALFQAMGGGWWNRQAAELENS